MKKVLILLLLCFFLSVPLANAQSLSTVVNILRNYGQPPTATTDLNADNQVNLMDVGLSLKIPVTPPTPTTATTAGNWWKPAASAPISWHWQLTEDFQYPRDVINNVTDPVVTVYDIDGEKATKELVSQLHALKPGVKVICYFDAGVYETYRSDAASFPASVIGPKDVGWDGSFWLDIRKRDIILPIMERRIKNWCADKGFDAIEPDETEVWSNWNQARKSDPISKEDNNKFNQAIADLAHKYNLSVALKGNTTEAGELEQFFDFSINEQCWQYSECDNMNAFLSKNKAVFNVEYSGTPNCTQANAMHMNSVKRDLNLVGPKNGSYKATFCEPYGATSW